MNINELVDVIKDITLNKIDCRSFYVGNTWDMSTGKGDVYPNLWLELPILVDYSNTGKPNKQLTFSVDLLTLAKTDDVADEVNMISHMEELADEFLQYLKQNKDFALIDSAVGLSVKSINADNAVGIRIDIKVNTPRVCLT